MKQILTAQYLIKTNNSSIASGFNMFVHGHFEPNFSDRYHDIYERLQGYSYAKKMAKEDGIAFTKIFKCRCGGSPFIYGGAFVCNTCGTNKAEEKWWDIYVEKDGNQYCCKGLDFVNLQESNNYAFGDTFEQAIDNYGKLMSGGF